MAKRKVKGFTLIECLVALGILGVASLLLCQAYVQLMNITNGNNTITASIGQQMASAEAGSDDSTNVKKFRTCDPDPAIPPNYVVELTDVAGDSTITTKAYRGSSLERSTKVDVYAAYAKGVQHNNLDEDSSKQAADVRYVYFH